MNKNHLTFAMLLVAICGCETAKESPQKSDHISFVSCPVVRDTRSVPCWTSEYQGSTYYLTIQSDVSAHVQPPMLGHQVLVEGIVSNEASICGGIVLKDVHLSVMPELDANCNIMLPADENITIDFNPRPPGPSGGRLAFDPDPAQVKETLPAANGPQKIDIYFDFDKGVSFRHPGVLTNILDTAETIHAKSARIIGVRGAHELSNGAMLQETPNMGQKRAEEVAMLLQGAGLKAEVAIDWIDGKSEADGKNDWQTRRVTVELLP